MRDRSGDVIKGRRVPRGYGRDGRSLYQHGGMSQAGGLSRWGCSGMGRRVIRDGSVRSWCCGKCPYCRDGQLRQFQGKVAAEMEHAAVNGGQSVLVTLTFRDPAPTEFDLKGHLRGPVEAFRIALKRLPDPVTILRTVKVGEIGGERGRIHYHVLFIFDKPVEWGPDFPDRTNCCHWHFWPHGFAQRAVAMPKKGSFLPVGRYIGKYVYKGVSGGDRKKPRFPMPAGRRFSYSHGRGGRPFGFPAVAAMVAAHTSPDVLHLEMALGIAIPGDVRGDGRQIVTPVLGRLRQSLIREYEAAGGALPLRAGDSYCDGDRDSKALREAALLVRSLEAKVAAEVEANARHDLLGAMAAADHAEMVPQWSWEADREFWRRARAAARPDVVTGKGRISETAMWAEEAARRHGEWSGGDWSEWSPPILPGDRVAAALRVCGDVGWLTDLAFWPVGQASPDDVSRARIAAGVRRLRRERWQSMLRLWPNGPPKGVSREKFFG